MEEQREPVHVDGLLDVVVAAITQARKDYAAGPTNKHYHSAERFLAEAGLLERMEGAEKLMPYVAEDGNPWQPATQK